MRCKILLLALAVVVACGAGPFRGGFVGRPVGVPAPAPAPAAQPVGGYATAPRQAEVVQVLFRDKSTVKPASEFSTMKIETLNPDAATLASSDSSQIGFPGFQNCFAGKSYRLRLSDIPRHDGTILYPTLTVYAVSPRTRAYLEHNAIPVKFTADDFEQVESGNFVTKVIFLPSPQFQNLALSGATDTIVNTQLPAGTDPIAAAQNRGAILAIVQIGNKNLGLNGGDMFAGSSVPAGPNQQFPISGVNTPAFGTPASEAVAPNPTVLPTVPAPEQPKMPLIEEASPNPSTGIPAVESNWNGSNF